MPARLLDDLGVDRSIIDLGGRIANDPGKWLDATHANAWGAAELTARLADEIVRRHPMLGEEGCPKV